MTKTTKITLAILIIFIFLSGGLFGFYSYIIKSDNQIDNFEEFKDTYIFGRPTSQVVGGDGFGLATSTDDFIDLNKDVEIPKLRKISDFPVAGFFSIVDKEGITSIRYIERSTGHIYETKSNTLTTRRISNTTIPRVQETVWIDKESLVIRYLDDSDNIKSFYAKIVGNKENELSEGKTEGVFLPDNMKEVISLGNRLFFLLDNEDGARGFTSDLNGENIVSIFNSPLRELIIERPKQGILTLTTKPSYDVFGYLYFLNTNTERMDKKLSERGLTTLANNNLSGILFSGVSGSYFNLNLYNIKDNERVAMPLDTLSEKCVWSDKNIIAYCGAPNSIPRGNYPDDWYQGIISFSDDVWKLDTEIGTAELLISPQKVSRTEIDFINPTLGPDEKYLFFMNKKDLTLWSLEL